MVDHVNHPKIIGIYEIIFGGMGSLTTLFQLISYLSASTVDFVVVSNFFLGFTLFVICAYAGYRLYQRSMIGFNLSIWIQAAQIPKLAIAGFSYFFAAGPYLVCGLMEDLSFGFFFNISLAQFQFGLLSDASVYFFSANLIAISLCIYLFKLHKLRKIEEQLVNLKVCPYCSVQLNLDKENVSRKLSVFCNNCKSAIQLADIS